MKKVIYGFLIFVALLIAVKIVLKPRISTQLTGENNFLNKKPTPTKVIVWKDYIDNKLGFSLRYPSDWEEPVSYPQLFRTEVHFDNDNFIVFMGKVFRSNTGKSLSYEGYVEEFTKETGSPGEDVVVSDISGKKFKNPLDVQEKTGFNLVFPTRTKNKILEIYWRYQPDDKQTLEIYEQILQSFKLVQ